MPRVPGPPRLPQPTRGHARPPRCWAPRSPAPAARTLPRPTPQQAARRKALIALVDRVADAVDLSSLDRGAGRSRTRSRTRSTRPRASRPRRCATRARPPRRSTWSSWRATRCGSSSGSVPFGPLLEDDQATEIHVPRPDVVLAVRDGQLALRRMRRSRARRRWLARVSPSGAPVGRTSASGRGGLRSSPRAEARR